jgi:hypothetical protein
MTTLERTKMDDEEYRVKYINLRVLKSAQEYLKTEGASPDAVYPIRVPDDLLVQAMKLGGAEKADKLIHHIFTLGLTLWSEALYDQVFGSQKSLEDFIKLVKERKDKDEQKPFVKDGPLCK